MSSSFITGPPDERAGLLELMAYLRPKSKGAITAELHRSLQARPREEDTQFAGILGELGITPQEFAQMAHNRPELWDREQTEYLEAIANGYPHTDLIFQLAEDFFTEAAAPPPQLLEQVDEDDELDEEGLDPVRRREDILTQLVAPNPALTPLGSVETLPIVGDQSDDWWKKK